MVTEQTVKVVQEFSLTAWLLGIVGTVVSTLAAMYIRRIYLRWKERK